MPKTSAGILLYHKRDGILEVFLIHPGGPFFSNKDAGVWSIPKGEIDEGEDALSAARREFSEETGCIPEGSFVSLSSIQQKSGKIVLCWAAEGVCDAETIISNLFSLEWPPRSGKIRQFPEVDRAGWFPVADARRKINPAQLPFLDRLQTLTSE